MKRDEYINQMKNISPSEDLIKKTISNIEHAKMQEEIKKQSKWKKALAGAVAMVTLSVGSVGAYVGITGNTEILEKLGIHISQNYEKNKQEINDENTENYVQLADGVQAKLVAVSLDNTNMVMEIDLKLEKDIEDLNPDLKISNVAIYMPERQTEISEELVISEKSSSVKVEDGTWKIYKYISIKDYAVAGNSLWADIFYADNKVNCKVEFSGLFDGENLISSFEDNNRVFEFELNKPNDLKDISNSSYDKLITYKNITIDGFEVQPSDFGNVVGFVANEKDIDIDKVNDIQKIDFIIKDANGTKLNIVSKNENINVGDYREGKLHQIGLEVQIVVDDVSENTNYTIEMVENEKVQVSNERIKEVYDSVMNDYTSGEWALTPDGVVYRTSKLNEKDYYVDEYGVYRTYKTARQIDIDTGLYVKTIPDNGLFPIDSIVDPENQSNNENKKSDSNSTTSINYSDTLSNYDKMQIAYSLIAYSGDFDSTAEISKEVVISTLFGVVDSKITTDPAITSLFDEYNEAWKVHEYDENDVKKAAKDILDLELTGSSDKYNYIRYKNGKYYSVDIPADGEYLTIKKISNNGDTYTFYALSALDSQDMDISEYSKYEVVIKDGVIKSGRKII